MEEAVRLCSSASGKDKAEEQQRGFCKLSWARAGDQLAMLPGWGFFFWKVGYVLKGPVLQPAALALACCCYRFLSDLRLPWLLVSGFIELVLIDRASASPMGVQF
jgi:hypothetical protein